MDRRLLSGALSALLVAAGLTACEPPPPRVELVVNTQADGSDANPGDGDCVSDEADGDCTLRAAVEEANAIGRGRIRVPAGGHSDAEVTVTGDVVIVGAGLTRTGLAGRITVAEQGLLRLDRIGSVAGPSFSGFLDIQVDGSLHLTRSHVAGIDRSITVGTNGGAVIDSSILAGVFDVTARTRGNLVINRSNVNGVYFSSPGADVALDVAEGGFAALQGSWITNATSGGTACVGAPPTSLGYNHSTGASCELSAIGDQTGGAPIAVFEPAPPPADSALVDAIPLGTAGCVEGATDALGNPRGVDGNGDGVGGCDIGAIERQPNT